MAPHYSGKVFARVEATTVDPRTLSKQLSGLSSRAARLEIVKKAVSGRSVIPDHDLCPKIRRFLPDLCKSGDAVLVQVGLQLCWGNPKPPKLSQN